RLRSWFRPIVLPCRVVARPRLHLLFFLPAPPTPETYTLSLHDALPISARHPAAPGVRRRSVRPPPLAHGAVGLLRRGGGQREDRDRKSTRLNSSHVSISYAVFCLKKKKKSNGIVLCARKHAGRWRSVDA